MAASAVEGRAAEAEPTLGRVAACMGKGLVAGLAGTAVMTLAQRAQMAATGRGGSDMPARAVEKVFGIRFADEPSRERSAQLTHWTYGTSMGAVRGLLGAVGVGDVAATGAHFAVAWGGSTVALPAMGLAPPATEWSPRQVATDAGFHAVYALASGAVYAWLDR